MSSLCRACDRVPTTAFLCRPCTAALEKVLAELPAGLRDVELAAARQTSIEAAARLRPVPPEDKLVEAEHRAIPAWLRSPHAANALVANPMPVNLDAATLHAQAVNGVLGWARHLAESRGVELPTTDPVRRIQTHQQVTSTGELVEVCTWSWSRPPVTLETLCTWLLTNLNSIRMDEAAAEIHAAALDLAGCIEALTDRQAPDVFAGRCEAMVMSAAVVDGVVVPELAKCGIDLFCMDGDEKVTCPNCGTVYDLARQRAQMLDLADDEWARPQLIADALTELDEPVNASTLRSWIARDERVGKRPEGPIHARCAHSSCADMRRVDRGAGDRPLILQRGIDDDGRPLYRVGDVRARIAWAKERHAERGAGSA